MISFRPSFLSARSGANASKSLIMDLFAIAVVASVIIFFSWGAKNLHIPASDLTYQQINLDMKNIPYYAFHTTFRMLIAIVASVIFSLIYATAAAKSKRMEEILLPFLDILQSVPILGYISFTVTAFIALAPNTVLGIEMAVIFAIFTSQAWNLTFSVYQSLKSIPLELEEAAITFKMNKWQKFWRLEVPYCMPGIIWNMTVSMAGGWFYGAASESITVGNNAITLPGLGSYIALALTQQNLAALFTAVSAMCMVIFVYNFIIFNPLIVWSNKFKYEMTKGETTHTNIVLEVFRHSQIIAIFRKLLGYIADLFINLPIGSKSMKISPYIEPSNIGNKTTKMSINFIWYSALLIAIAYLAHYINNFLIATINMADIISVARLVSITFLRVISMIFLLSLILIPIGVYIGTRPRLTTFVQPILQFLASFPVNIFFPIVVIYVTRYHLNPDIWLSPLMVLGTMWLLLFNIMSGAAQIPTEIREVYRLFNIKGLLWWKKVMLPAILPSYITGAITASGNAWNASIIAEAVSWGDTHIYAKGIGSYITHATAAGNFPHIALGIITMSIIVVFFNKIFWQPLYNYTTKKYSY